MGAGHLGSEVVGAAILDRKSWGPPSWTGSDVKCAKVAPILLATVARQMHDVHENVVRRSMVINARNFIGRTSCECLANVARMS